MCEKAFLKFDIYKFGHTSSKTKILNAIIEKINKKIRKSYRMQKNYLHKKKVFF